MMNNRTIIDNIIDINNNIAHAAGRSVDYNAILKAYTDNIAPTMTQAVANMIKKAIQKGLSQNDIIHAIEITGFAPRPTPWYLRAVLNNWCENGVNARQKQQYDPRRGHERTYTEDENRSCYFDLEAFFAEN